MRYFWKLLSRVTGLLLVGFTLPTLAMTRIHLWVCMRANPTYTPVELALSQFSTIPGCPGPQFDHKKMGETVAEMMRAANPELVDKVRKMVAAKMPDPAPADPMLGLCPDHPFAAKWRGESLPRVEPVIPAPLRRSGGAG